MNKRIYKTIPHILAAAIIFFAGAQVVFAATSVTYYPLTTIPGVFTAKTATNPVSVVKGLYGLAIGAGSIIAVVMIIMAGFKYMYEESISGKSGAKEQIQNAFLGLIVILGSYILLRTVNAELVNFNPQLPGGSGGVSSLVANAKDYDSLEAALHKAAAESTTRLQEIDTLKGTITAKDTEIANIQKRIDEIKKQPQNATTAKEISDLQSSITQIQADKSVTQNLVNIKTVEQLSKTTADIIKNETQLTLSKQIDAIASGDPNQAYLATRTALDTVEQQIEHQKNVLDSRAKEAAALNTTGDASTAKDAYLAEVEQNKGYLEASQNMVKGASAIADESFGDLAGKSARFAAIVDNTNNTINFLEAHGRDDLADYLRADMDKTEKLLKLANAQGCPDDPIARDKISLCKQ